MRRRIGNARKAGGMPRILPHNACQGNSAAGMPAMMIGILRANTFDPGLRSYRRGFGVIAASLAACSASSWAADRAEIVARSGFAAEHAVAPLDDVQIDLENATFVQDRFEQHRDQRFLALAPVAALARQEQVLRELLRNRRSAGDDATLAQVLVHRVLDAFPVESFVLDESCVFRGDHRALEMDRNALIRHPDVLQARAGARFLQFGQPHSHERCLARWVITPPPDVDRIPGLQEHERGQQRERRPDRPAQRRSHPLASARRAEQPKHGNGVGAPPMCPARGWPH